MNKEILKIQAARFGIHLIGKLPYDIFKKYGPNKVYNEIKLCFRKDINLTKK